MSSRAHKTQNKAAAPEAAPDDAVANDAVANDTRQRADSFASRYERHRSRALAVDARDLTPATCDPVLVLHNVRTALKNLRPHEAKLRLDPTVAWDDVFALEELAEGFVFACDRVTAPVATGEQVAEKRAELQALRAPALLILRGLAMLEKAPPMARVEAIEAGSGLIDMGRDGIALAALFREFEGELAGKHPFTVERVARLEALGEWVLRNVTPEGTRAAPATSSEAERVRDGFWAEIQRVYKGARAAGFKQYGEDFGRHVPALQSRAAAPRKVAEAEEPDGDGSPHPA